MGWTATISKGGACRSTRTVHVTRRGISRMDGRSPPFGTILGRVRSPTPLQHPPSEQPITLPPALRLRQIGPALRVDSSSQDSLPRITGAAAEVAAAPVALQELLADGQRLVSRIRSISGTGAGEDELASSTGRRNASGYHQIPLGSQRIIHRNDQRSSRHQDPVII